MSLATIVIATIVSTVFSIADIESQVEHEMRLFHDSIHLYRDQVGIFPTTDDRSTWYWKLRDYGILEGFAFSTMGEGQEELPVDPFGNPYRLAIRNGKLIVWSVGKNGINESGAGDDWQYGSSPAWGTWYKKNYSLGIGMALLSGIILVAVGVLLRRRPWIMLSVSLTFGGISAAFIPLFVVHGLGTPARMGPPLEPLVTSGLLAALVGTFLSLALLTRHVIRRSVRKRDNQCISCGYSLSGLHSERCPECGEAIQGA